jgi:deazaflavin-dependent oxidoreductase (nitroreductase family)
MIRAMLRAPLSSRVVGKRLITMYVVGRKSGKHYTIPVAYTRLGATLLVGSQFAWVRNLGTDDNVEIRLCGTARSAQVQVLSDEAAVVEHLAIMAADNHQFAKFNKIGFEKGGSPRIEDLRLAWVSGARVVILTPM